MSDLMTCGEFKAMIRDLPDDMPVTFGVLVLYESAYATSEGDREVIRIEVKVS